jgi:hypothetical protein
VEEVILEVNQALIYLLTLTVFCLHFKHSNYSIAHCSLADGATLGVLGTEPDRTSVDELAQEDIDPMQEDLLNEIYQNTADVSHTIS